MKYLLSEEEKNYTKQTIVKVAQCAKEGIPDFLIGYKDNCLVKVVPADVETPPSGTATLVGGTVTVPQTSVTTNSRIIVTRRTAGGTLGHITVTRSNGVSFTIGSSSGTETSTFDWVIFN